MVSPMLFRSSNGPNPPGRIKSEVAVANDSEKPGRQKAIGYRAQVAPRHGSQVRSGPDEFVQLADDDPGLLTVQAEASLGRPWNLHGHRRVGRGRMRYR